ncbi:glycosyltransferase [Undibacter mobilis]|uniref:Glycosyltransferase family 1 protein n=1 Tax=Undibacter mobilis TaxID=2292256 RepID=A0A371B6F7_9BRAD|nr:glycosyltransferase [Undibacter mobilis]RDV03144.1 glycosyltransferase family 1 protein [Undibacter mobilis]
MADVGPVSEAPLRVAVISVGLPYPATGASTVVFNYYMKALCAARYKIDHVVVAEADWSVETEKAYRNDIGAAANFSLKRFSAVPVVSASRMALTEHPRLSKVRDYLKSLSPDAIVCFDIECALIAAPIDAAKFAWIGDLHYQTAWYHFLYSVQESLKNALSTVWILRRIALWKDIYRRSLSRFSDVIVCAHRSVADLSRLGLTTRFAPYPWPAAANHEDELPKKPDKPSFIFFGKLGGLGSRSSFHFLLERLYPKLVSIWGRGGFVIDICGMQGLPDWVERAITGKPEFRFLGFVANLDSQMRHYHAMVVPIDVPIGNRTRILTAQAGVLPVVAHESVALGNPSLVDGDTCRLARGAGEFAAALRWSFEKPEEARRMAERGRKSWELEYSPAAAADVFVKAIQSHLVGQRA